jgi:hypothetical protein
MTEEERPSLPHHRQADGKRRPLSDGAFDSDRAAVTMDNLANNVQAQALAVDVTLANLRPADEPLEDPVPFLWQNADAVVRDANRDRASIDGD